MLSFILDVIKQYTLWLYLICGLFILLNLRAFAAARRDRRNTIFPIEREIAAHREGRAMSNIGLILGVVILIVVAKYYVLPAVDLQALAEATPTPTFSIPTRPPTPTEAPPTPTPTPTPTRRIVRVTPPPPPTDTPPPPPPCPDPNTCIVSPTMNEKISGHVVIRGTANHGRFQFYKIEYGIGENPTAWHSINEIVKTPVINGPLMEFDSRALPNGVYWLKLTVVDITGNFPPPYQVRVIIEN